MKDINELKEIIKMVEDGKIIELAYNSTDKYTIRNSSELFMFLNNVTFKNYKVITSQKESTKIPLTVDDFKGMPVVWVKFANGAERPVSGFDKRLNEIFVGGCWCAIKDLQVCIWSTDRVNWKPFYKDESNPV